VAQQNLAIISSVNRVRYNDR